ncbi:hypothetical protein AB6A40_005155 [Gnathostoma spinigerum]|uniref:Cyclin B n=1 Tax=Gnathostoma spinigerum TaxID=75299 RepID=A0ABD6ELY9_9BILA
MLGRIALRTRATSNPTTKAAEASDPNGKATKSTRSIGLSTRNQNVCRPAEKNAEDKGIKKPASRQNSFALKGIENAGARERVPKTKKETAANAQKVSTRETKEGTSESCSAKMALPSGEVVQSYTAARFEEVVLHCEEYSDDMYNYIYALEKKFGVEENFLQGCEVTYRMRHILVDWLIQVQIRFHMLPETLFLTINLLDRYLSTKSVTKADLQLVGVTCMFIAAKYEEMYPPELHDFVYITDNSFTKNAILKMEIKILSAIGLDLGRPQVIQFIRYLSTNFNTVVHPMAKYIGEIAVCDYSTAHLLPSEIAAAAVWLAARLEENRWPQNLYRVARIKPDKIREYGKLFAKNILKSHGNQKLTALRSKYASTKNARVSCFTDLQIDLLRELSS